MKTIKEQIEESAKVAKKCILCDSLTHNRGYFVPYNLKEFNLEQPASGKIRGVVYPLCENHNRKDDDVILRIEKIILYTLVEFKEEGGR